MKKTTGKRVKRSQPGTPQDRPGKKPVTLRLDTDVLAWLKKGGRGYQTRINRALRTMMLERRKVK